MKVFGVGFSKTGTVSFGKAMQLLQYNHCHGSYVTGNLLLHSYLSGNHNELHKLIAKHDSFDDLPFCAPGVPQMLDKRYPNAKFVLTTRDPESWYSSMHRYLPKNMAQFRGRDGLPLGPFYGLVNYILAIFGTTDLTNKKHVIETYNAYNQSIIDHFSDRSDKLLVVSWMNGEGWPELCKFLGKPKPALKFPHANKNNSQ
jgi:hypothetical protein